VPFTHSTAIAVEIVDASGNQITAFGGGTTTVVGTVTTVPTGTQSVAQTGSPWGVSGTVTAVESGTWSVTVSGTATTAPTGTQTVAGTVSLSGTDTVVGTVTTIPSGTQTIAGTVSILGGTSTATLSNLTSDQLDNDYALVVEDKRLRRLLEKIVIKSLDDEEIGRRYAVGKVGPTYVSDQAWLEHRLDRSGALVTADGHARYQEAVSRGNVYWVISPAIAPSNLSSTCSGLILYNPINSKKNLSILSVGVNYASTLLSNNTAYKFCIEAASSPVTTVPSGTTTLSIYNSLINGNTAQGVGIAYSTATFANAPTLSLGISSFQMFGTYGTAAAAAFSYPSFVDFGGIIAVAPGAFINIGAGATAVAAALQIVWEEIPI